MTTKKKITTPKAPDYKGLAPYHLLGYGCIENIKEFNYIDSCSDFSSACEEEEIKEQLNDAKECGQKIVGVYKLVAVYTDTEYKKHII